MQKSVAHQVERVACRIDDHDIPVADIAHVRFVADHGLYIDAERSHSRTNDFAKIRGAGQDDLSERLTNTGGGALVSRFELAPEVFDLRFLIKICEHLAKTIERKHIWRQFLTFEDGLELRRRPGNQSKGHKTGESRPGVTQRMLAIVIA